MVGIKPRGDTREKESPIRLFGVGLSQIDQEIQRVANAKLQQEHLLGLFWEHMPPIDPQEIRTRMLAIQANIRELAERKRELIEERDALMGPEQP